MLAPALASNPQHANTTVSRRIGISEHLVSVASSTTDTRVRFASRSTMACAVPPHPSDYLNTIRVRMKLK